MTPEFWITSLVVVLVPGTGVVYTLAVALGRGFRAGTIAAFGCTLGIVPHLVASILGLAALLHASAVLFQTVKWAGVLYLLWMAWGALQGGGALDVEGRRERVPAWRIVRDGIALNVLNPKLTVFFLAFLPHFVVPGDPRPTLTLALLALIFMAMTFAVFVLYGALASAARAHVLGRPAVMAWMRRSFAAAFAALGMRLALAER